MFEELPPSFRKGAVKWSSKVTSGQGHCLLIFFGPFVEGASSH